MMKKTTLYTTILALVATLTVGCEQHEPIEFASSDSAIEIDAVGGVRKVKISAEDEWVTVVSKPWITFSPANGRGSTECQIAIDSALNAEGRTGEIYIQIGRAHV